MEIDTAATEAYKRESIYEINSFHEEIYDTGGKLLSSTPIEGIPVGRSCGGSNAVACNLPQAKTFVRGKKKRKLGAGERVSSVILPICGRMKNNVHNS